MIVVLGRADDPPISLTLEALHEFNFDHRFVEIGTLDRDGLRFQVRGNRLAAELLVAGELVLCERIQSVYARPIAGHRGKASGDEPRARRALDDFTAWLDATAAFVVNRPRAMHSNNSKPLQAQWIGAAGFLVPETLITNSAEEALSFREQHGRVIYKSISGIRSIVRELDDASARRLTQLRALPVQFQAYVAGLDVRVHVVGTECFAAEIHSTAIDYRYVRGAEKTALQVHNLPDDVAHRCMQLAAAFDLPLAGIDLRLTPDGDYVCFEVNPMPAFSYYESHTGLPISRALAQMLSAGR